MFNLKLQFSDFLAKYDPEELSEKISSQDLKKCIDYANNSHYQENSSD